MRLTIFLYAAEEFFVSSLLYVLEGSSPASTPSARRPSSAFRWPPLVPAQTEITLMYLILSSQLPSYIFLNDLSFKCYCTYTAIEENVPFLALLFNTRAFFILTKSPFFLHTLLSPPPCTFFLLLPPTLSTTFCSLYADRRLSSRSHSSIF